MKITKVGSIILLFFCINVFLSASSISASFDSSLEGWTAQNADYSWQSSGGNPGGYLQVIDLPSPMYVSAPSAFLGNLSGYNNGIISFDIKEFSRNSDDFYVPFGEITIAGASTSVTYDTTTQRAQSSWTNYSVSLNASVWGKTETEWLNLLSNVTSISVMLESANQTGEYVGFDNFTIASNIPEVSTWLLFVSGIFVCGFFRKK